MIQYYKTTANGTDGCRILPAHSCFARRTNLPTDWKRARVGVIFSFTALAEPNAIPTKELLNFGATSPICCWFGLVTPGGNPVTNTGKFVGHCIPNPVAISYETSRHCCLASATSGYNVSGLARLKDGATSADSQYATVETVIGDPELTSAYAVGLALDIDVSTAGVLSVSRIHHQKLSAGGDPQMMSLLIGATTNTFTPVSGGWWSATTPVGATELFIASPWTQNRMRIHSTGWLRLA